MFLVASGMFAMFFFNTLYIQRVLGFGPLEGRPRVPAVHRRDHALGRARLELRAADRRAAGRRRSGWSLTVVGMLLLRAAAGPTARTLADVLPALIVTSLGMGAIFMPLTLIATTGLKDEDQGLASGLFNTSQQVGGALGLAILSTFAASTTTAATRGVSKLVGARARLPLRVRGGARSSSSSASSSSSRCCGSHHVAPIEPEAASRRRRRLMVELRADARRNLERVLDAAARCFAEDGPDASVDEIARRAGVGHGTVFRRFPTKDDLVYAVVERHVAQMRTLAEEALDDGDPGAAFFGFVRTRRRACA